MKGEEGPLAVARRDEIIIRAVVLSEKLDEERKLLNSKDLFWRTRLWIRGHRNERLSATTARSSQSSSHASRQ